MEEKELIGKLRELRQIKPNRNWVVLTKYQILGKERKISLGYYLRIMYGGLAVVFFLFGLFTLSQNSLPGEFLYPIKKISEKAQVVFISEKEKPQVTLELANKRLEELTKITETNQVKNLAPAINEFQASVSEAAKNLSRVEATSSDPMAVKRFIDQAKKIGEKVKKVKSLGVVIEEKKLNELEEVSSKLELQLLISALKNMISDLENRTLTEKQEEILLKMRELVEKEKYSEALELYLINQ
jgi:hypothetical protein